MATPLASAPATDPTKEPGEPGTSSKSGGKASAAGRPAGKGTATVRPQHRVRFGLGVGRGGALQAVLTESPSAWLINSAVHAATDPANNQVAVPISEARATPYVSWMLFADYAYSDRWFVSLSRTRISQKLSRAQKGMVSYAAPATSNLFPSAFEGVRLLRYTEERQHLELAYLHPLLTRGLKAGGAIGRERHAERDSLSFGSYAQFRSTATGGNASTAFWSQGGSVESLFEAQYWTLALLLRYQLFDWLGFLYRVEPFLRRSGDLTLSGAQLLTSTVSGSGAGPNNGLVPLHSASLAEKGRRHRLEATLRFCCRYNLTVGMLREDWTRTYDSYLGTTLSSGGTFNARTRSGIGFGEMAGSFRSHKQELYVKLSVAVFFGRGRAEPAVQPVERQPSGFGLKEGELQNLGSPKYLDKMFDGMKSDFEESGVELTEIAQGFEAVGLKLEKVPGADGKTKELRVTMDGTIGFELGSARLTKIASELVGKVAKAMKAYPETNAKIGGHVDCCAARSYNLRLSQARADAARTALIDDGVAAKRILESWGYADDRMLIPVRRLEPRNRRVEIIIVTE